MRKKIVAGNWKMNTAPNEGVELVRSIIDGLKEVSSDVSVIVAPPFTHLSQIKNEIQGSRIALSAQNCADHPKGAYTGEVSVSMLAAVGCEYTILGHSERREYYGENSDTLTEKINLVLANDLIPIFCVGEKLSQREDSTHFTVVAEQISSVLFGLETKEFAKVVIAYEPVWAIGTGKTATAEQAQEMHLFIRSKLREHFGNIADNTAILYGGSVNASNAQELFAQPDIDGGLIGGASLKADDFIKIARAF